MVINSLLKESEQYTYANLPKSEYGYPTHVPALFIVWAKRVDNIIKQNTKSNSAPYILVESASGKIDQIKGYGQDQFDSIKEALVTALQEAKNILENDLYGELPSKNNENRDILTIKKQKWYQTKTFKSVVKTLAVTLFLGIPSWLWLFKKTDHNPSINTSISSETKTSGDISPAFSTSGPNSPIILNGDLNGEKNDIDNQALPPKVSISRLIEDCEIELQQYHHDFLKD